MRTNLIDRMAAGQVSAVATLLETMLDPLARSLASAPYDDEPVSAEEARELEADQGIARPRRRHPSRKSSRRVWPSSEDFERMGRTSSA